MGPLTTRTPWHVMLSVGPSVLVRPVGRHIGPGQWAPQELSTMRSTIAVVETDGVVRGASFESSG